MRHIIFALLIIFILCLSFNWFMAGRAYERDYRRERQKQGDIEYYDEFNQTWLWKKAQ